jgi:hypothetical protein
LVEEVIAQVYTIKEKYTTPTGYCLGCGKMAKLEVKVNFLVMKECYGILHPF